MNRKGFTLVELLATLVILGIVISIVVVISNGAFNGAKKKTEDVFVGTLEDALDIYLDSDAKKLKFDNRVCSVNKSHGSVNVYKSNEIITFNNIINSKYSPLDIQDLINPANKDVECLSGAIVNIYRDDDYVYYYMVNKDDFGCLTKSGTITNLPECN